MYVHNKLLYLEEWFSTESAVELKNGGIFWSSFSAILGNKTCYNKRPKLYRNMFLLQWITFENTNDSSLAAAFSPRILLVRNYFCKGKYSQEHNWKRSSCGIYIMQLCFLCLSLWKKEQMHCFLFDKISFQWITSTSSTSCLYFILYYLCQFKPLAMDGGFSFRCLEKIYV